MADLQAEMIPDGDAAVLGGALSALRTGTLSVAHAYSVREAADWHGLQPWLAEAALSMDPRRTRWPSSFKGEGSDERAWLSRRIADAVAEDAVQHVATRRAVDALGNGGVRVLLLKGEHLARAFYPRPHWRPRLDVDMLVPPDARTAARRILEELGYRLVPHVSGEAILGQMHFSSSERTEVHPIDLHWRVLNPLAFRTFLPFDDLWNRSQFIPELGSHARGPCPVHALLLAVAHHAVHHPTRARLIWLADIDLLARALGPEDWSAFARSAATNRMCSFARAALDLATRFFETPVPPTLTEVLEANGADEPIARHYLRPHSRAGRLLVDIRALPAWRDRVAVLYEHLVPDAEYMRERYQTQGIGLAWAYVCRIANGARVWLTQSA